jgi:uncharacterized protein YqeY
MLIQDIKKANIEAMKAHDADKRGAYSIVISRYQTLATSGKGEPTDADVIQIIQKLGKELDEEREGYLKAGREESAAKIAAQKEAISAFLPKQLSEEEIKKALMDAQAYDFVSRYDDYLDHPVEEGGLNFSGGQKQRLLIARALLSNRPVLILDDSTSALDYKTDLLVREAIKKKKGLTTIIVSQRATSIADCDTIFVLDKGRLVASGTQDKGRLVASGTHDELLSSCDIYREIYTMQVNGK